MYCPHLLQSLFFLDNIILSTAVWVAVRSAAAEQTGQPPIHSGKYQCHIDTVSSPDDGHIVARNM